ncbi:MAG: glycosyltransferase family 2 protein, partial [Anaerolineae bacterium]|nr:glycosyltransferase family 2 protein [Anaerolineae bacterium]
MSDATPAPGAAPCVSIGLPVYNGETYLAAALDSILGQTFRDFELIIADNHSSDGTVDICRAYAAQDARVHLVVNEQNLGAAKNYNLVFDLARGKYFKWASHDDLIAPEFLARCVEALEADPAVVVAYPQTVLIDATGATTGAYENRFDLRSPRPHQRLLGVFQAPGRCHPVFG